ncbi:hypothetical protein CY652_06825 [Burkholderia sp. WAC0059]|uniref:translesion DNA synthesis-associated protein ImuA n=1 Tax=Burkholderia sp. WAC0059 TaxID=2066022 RepID=UPI000C7EECB1|nr:translesion DNA synthesis-associated protein ImuA [Burkholderia sp. WAC0059]PLZ03025.1 hypothetical protein CY652_06825 [Burkholderia sp. WAC0059]
MAAAIRLATTGLPERLQSRVWQGDQLAHAGTRSVSSGYPELDALLPGRGWSAGSLAELLVDEGGIGEMRLLAPVLRALTAQSERYVLLIAPPWQPYACALRRWGVALGRVVWVRAAGDEALWAAGQALRQEGVGAVLVWLAKARPEAVRRLQVAAQDSGALAFAIRPLHARGQSSPAPLRMTCTPSPPPAEGTVGRRRRLQLTGLSIDIFKRRGPPPAEPLNLVLPLEAAVLPEAASAVPASRTGTGVHHVVDCRNPAAVAAGSREAAAAARDAAAV